MYFLRLFDDYHSEIHEIDANSLDEAIELVDKYCDEYFAAGSWREDDSQSVTIPVNWAIYDLHPAKEEANLLAQGGRNHTLEAIAPPCSCDEGHLWRRRLTGCKENPGVHGIDGGAIITVEICLHCGIMKKEISGDCNEPNRDSVEYVDSIIIEGELDQLRQHYSYGEKQ